MKAMQFKGAGFKLKDMDMATGRVVLMASSFNNIDSDGDVMLFGCYAKSISENGPMGKNRIKQLWQHDPWTPIGVPKTMTETQDGLIVESYITDIKNGDYRKMYEDGIITEHSVGFIPVKEEYSESEGINYIKEVRLFEYSAVTWGANENTPVLGMKSMNPMEKANYLQERLNTYSKALTSGKFTDETFYQLQINFEQIKAEVQKALIDNGPQQSTQRHEPLNLVDLYETHDNLY